MSPVAAWPVRSPASDASATSAPPSRLVPADPPHAPASPHAAITKPTARRFITADLIAPPKRIHRRTRCPTVHAIAAFAPSADLPQRARGSQRRMEGDQHLEHASTVLDH